MMEIDSSARIVIGMVRLEDSVQFAIENTDGAAMLDHPGDKIASIFSFLSIVIHRVSVGLKEAISG